MKHYDLAEKSDIPEVSSKSRLYYPSMSVDGKASALFRGRKVGDKVRLSVLADVTGIRQDRNKKISFSFDLKKLAILKAKALENSKDEGGE